MKSILTPDEFIKSITEKIDDRPTEITLDCDGKEIKVLIGYSYNPKLTGCTGKLFFNVLPLNIEATALHEYQKLYDEYLSLKNDRN